MVNRYPVLGDGTFATHRDPLHRHRAARGHRWRRLRRTPGVLIVVRIRLGCRVDAFRAGAERRGLLGACRQPKA